MKFSHMNEARKKYCQVCDNFMCLNQLCLEYETKLLVMMSGRSPPVSTTVTREGRRGRPKKIINLALVYMTL